MSLEAKLLLFQRF